MKSLRKAVKTDTPRCVTESETNVLKGKVDWRGIPSSHNHSATGLLQASAHVDGHRVARAYQSIDTFHSQSRTQTPATKQQAHVSMIPMFVSFLQS